MISRLIRNLALVVGAALPLVAGALDFPNRPIRLVIPYAPGGGSDILARPVSVTMGESIKQPIVVDNKPGAGGCPARGAYNAFTSGAIRRLI